MTAIDLACEVLPAAYVILEVGGDTVRLTVTKEQQTASFSEQHWTCTAFIGAGHRGFTLQRGDRFYIYDDQDQLIGTSQLRLTYPVVFSPGDSLRLTYHQTVVTP